MLSYEKIPEVDADLEEIARYTILEWGAAQAGLYMDKLHQCFQNITSKKMIGKTFSNRYPHLFVIRCEHHYVFYFHPKKSKPIIIAVLHERMDLLTRLKVRLS